MPDTADDSLVTVYTSPVAADAEIVRGMLESEGIRATVAEASGAFSSLLVSPSAVLVWQNDEAQAKALIEQAERHHHARAGHEDEDELESSESEAEQ